MAGRTLYSKTTKPPYGPNIVRAWFDTVFHPALTCLENEINFLERRNWTFRQHTERLEYIALVSDYVGRGRENFEQLISFFPEIQILVKSHDERVRYLREACAAYFDAILLSDGFLKVYEVVKQEAPHVLSRKFEDFFGAYSEEEQFRRILAEYLVNSVGSQASYYATAELWNHFREAFASVTEANALRTLRGSTELAGQELRETTEELTLLLKNVRSELSLQFDVPVVAELSTSLR